MVRTIENTPLATNPHPTRQEVFDAVVAHAATMILPSKSEAGGCFYRLGDNACFIGGIVTDEEAARMDVFGDTTAIDVLVLKPDSPVPDRLRHTELVPILSALQTVHDGTQPMSEWPMLLKFVASDYELDDASVDRHFPSAPTGRNANEPAHV